MRLRSCSSLSAAKSGSPIGCRLRNTFCIVEFSSKAKKWTLKLEATRGATTMEGMVENIRRLRCPSRSNANCPAVRPAFAVLVSGVDSLEKATALSVFEGRLMLGWPPCEASGCAHTSVSSLACGNTPACVLARALEYSMHAPARAVQLPRKHRPSFER
eukprot:848706-Pleurochrysis_carterae.AAC.1